VLLDYAHRVNVEDSSRSDNTVLGIQEGTRWLRDVFVVTEEGEGKG